MTVKTKETTTEVVNIRLPQEITEMLDSLIKRGLYKSRSEAIRDFLRQYVIDNSEGAK